MNYLERINNAKINSAQEWFNNCNTLFDDYNKYFTSHQGKENSTIESLRSRTSTLISQADSFRKLFENNQEIINSIDEMTKYLSTAERDSKATSLLRNVEAQVSAQQRAPLPNFSAIKKEVDGTTINTPSADTLKKIDTREALRQMKGKQSINSFSNVITGLFTDYDKKTEKIALQQKEKLMQDKASTQWSAYRTALNNERAKVGLPSFSQETMDSINKTMTDNMLSSTDNGYTRTQKLNNLKYNGLFYGALSSSDFQSVSQNGAKKSAYDLSGNGLQEMHGVINGQQAPSSANRKYTQLNDSERQVWNYYIGKEETDEAIEFIHALEPTLESRLAEKISEEYDKQGGWGDAKELGVSAGGGLQKGVYDIIRSVYGTNEALGHHISDKMSYAFFAPTYSEKLTNAVLADKNGDDGWFFNLLCAALNSSTYQIPAMAISAMGGGMAGYVLQGIGSTTTEGIRNNTESVADVVYGAIQGAMEWAIDKALGGISSQFAGGGPSTLGKVLLNKIDDVIASPGVKKALSKLAIVGSSIVSENLEELIQMVVDPFARAVIYGEELDVSEITLENVVKTVIIASLSTLIMSPLTTNSSYKQYQSEKIGSGIIEMGGVESLVKFAEDFDANDTDVYDRVRTAFENKTEPDPMDVVSLYSAAMENYSKFSIDDAKKIAYNIADGGNIEGVARALFNGNTEAATKFIKRFSGQKDKTVSTKKTKATRNRNTEYVPQFTENMEDRAENAYQNMSETTSIKQQLQANADKLNAMEPVSNIEVTENLQYKEDTVNWALRFFEKLGFRVKREGLGDIIVDRKRISNGYKYLKTLEEKQAYAAVPYVLEKGIEIETHLRHKGRPYDTVTIAAPITLNGQRYNMAVVVRKDENNYYKVHRIVFPNGNSLLIEKRDSAGMAATSSNIDEIKSPTDTISNNTVPRNTGIVNNNISQNGGDNSENSDLQSTAKGISEPDISKDTRSHAEQVYELSSGKENKKAAARKEVQQLGKAIGWTVLFGDVLVKDKNGNTVYVTDQQGNKVPKRADAKVKKGSKTIVIDYQNKSPIKTLLKHELTHFLEINIGAYIDFANKVMDGERFNQWIRQKGFADIAAYREEVINRYRGAKGFETSQKAENSANLEMVAEFVAENLFGNERKMVKEIVQQISPSERTKFGNFLHKLFEKLKTFFKGKKQQSEIELLEQEWLKAYKAAEQVWQEQKNTTENSGEQYAISKDEVFEKYCDSIEKIAISDDISNKGQYIEVSQQTPRIIIEKANAKNLPMVMQFDTAYLETRCEGKLKGNYHDLGAHNMKQLPKLLETPEYIVRLPNGRLNIIVDMSTIKGKQALVSIELEQAKQVNGKFSKYNLILTAFGAKEHYLSSIVDNQQNEVVYNRKTESQGTDQLYKGLAGINDSVSNNNIPQSNKVVNSNYMQDAEEYAISSDATEDLLDSYESGELTREEFISKLKGKGTETPVEIAKMIKYDADTTPALKRREGENNGNKESKFYNSALESKIITDEVKQEIENDTYIKNYASMTNKRTLNMAMGRLEASGSAAVYDWFKKQAEECSPVDVGVGLILLERYQRAGDIESAVAVAEKLREIGTISGQTVQMFSILGRFTPEMMVVYAQKELDQAFEKMVEGKTKKWIEENKSKFELTSEDEEYIRRRTLQASLLEDNTRPKAILLAEICSRVQDKIPPSVADKIRAYQRICLLLNAKTNVRNILGNANMVGVYITSDLFGNLIDKKISKTTNVRTLGNMKLASIKDNAAAFVKGLYESYDDFKRGIQTKQEELNRFNNGNTAPGKNFNEQHKGKLAKQINAVARALNKLDNFTSFCLEAGDRPFFEMWFMNSLNNQLRLNNVQIPTESMIAIAREEAMQRTWQDNSKVAKTMKRIKDSLNGIRFKGGYGLGDVVLKFVKTPANIAKAMYQFSPIGFIGAAKNMVDMKNAIETGRFTPQMQHEAVRSMSNAITGTIIYALVAGLAGLGVISLSGAGDEDKDVSNFEKYIVGVPPYSIEFFGHDITYSWNQPMGTVLAAVADVMDSTKDGVNQKWHEDFLSAIKAAGTVFTEQTFLTNFYDLFAQEDLVTGAFCTILGEPTAFLPQAVSQLASFTDKYRRVTYDSNNKVQSAINNLIYKLPYLRTKLPKQVNILGEEIENIDYLNPWEAFLNPATTYPKSSGYVAEKIYEIYKETDNTTVLPKTAPNYISVKKNKIVFTPQEKQDFQAYMGKLSVQLLESMFSSPKFNKLEAIDKAKAINEVYSYAYEKAKCTVSYDYEIVSAMQGTKENGQPILTKEKYNNLSQKQRKILIEEYFLSNAELKCQENEEKLVELFIEKATK